MPFVRKRGNHLALVHGIRRPGTRNVEQQLLFTLYSRPEALAALGRPDPSTQARFESLIEGAHPNLHFDWKKIRKDIESELDALPETHDYDASRLDAKFMTALAAFARELAIADPDGLAVSARLIRRHRPELEYVRHLIEQRLERPGRPEDKWNQDNEFLWRFASRSNDVPAEVEEVAAHWYEQLEYERAAAAFRVLIAGFDDYAEGHNYLGLIALHEGRLDDAIACFKKTMEVGRRRLPKKIAKQRWWSDHETRPYMRGLTNLALTFNQAGRYDEALGACEQLAEECHETIEAVALRSYVYLNLGRWKEAFEAATWVCQLSPGHSLVAAFAAFERHDLDEARALFHHAALNRPRTVAIVVGAVVSRRPTARVDSDDHNGGVMMKRSLDAYLRKRKPAARRFFAELWKDGRVAQHREELDRVTKAWRDDRTGRDRTAFDRMQELQSWGFARQTMITANPPAAATVVRAPPGSKGGLRLVH